jgi:hypothetical protein
VDSTILCPLLIGLIDPNMANMSFRWFGEFESVWGRGWKLAAAVPVHVSLLMLPLVLKLTPSFHSLLSPG